jgi:hypothetical protein
MKHIIKNTWVCPFSMENLRLCLSARGEDLALHSSLKEKFLSRAGKEKN